MVLELKRCRLISKDCQILGTALQRSTFRLRQLFLDGNRIRDAGVVSLAPVIGVRS